MKLVSACLAGVKCRWNGQTKPCQIVCELVSRGKALPVCPELLGGLPIPREPAEIKGGRGDEVLDGKSRVIDRTGQDITEKLLKGAKETLKIAQSINADVFIGKSKSPSCSCTMTFDGSFKNKKVRGDGVTAALLKKHGIRVINENEL